MTAFSLSLTNRTAPLPQSHDCSRYVKQIDTGTSTALTAETHQLCSVVNKKQNNSGILRLFTESHSLCYIVFLTNVKLLINTHTHNNKNTGSKDRLTYPDEELNLSRPHIIVECHSVFIITLLRGK